MTEWVAVIIYNAQACIMVAGIAQYFCGLQLAAARLQLAYQKFIAQWLKTTN